MEMIGCYLTGMLPHPKELIEATRTYARGRFTETKLEKVFEEVTLRAIDAQLAAGFSYVVDGMLRWQDPFRPFAENLNGVNIGSLARWFNNNTFYRKPIVATDIQQKGSIAEKATSIKSLPKNTPWKMVVPAPYSFVQLSENQFYKSKTEFMFKYARVLREEIKELTKLGFKYVQLSDPALVYKPTAASTSRDELKIVKDALDVAVKGIPIKSCLQTFFGDFSQILPEALEFPVDHLGIDLYETSFELLKHHSFEKGVALGLVDSRSSLVENQDELVKAAKEILKFIYPSEMGEVFVCPNCDLEFLPWDRAEEKMKLIGRVAGLLREEFYG